MPIKRVALIEPRSRNVHAFTRWPLPRLGLPILGAILKQAGIDVTIYMDQVTRLDWEDIRASDLVGISTATFTANDAYLALNKIKQTCDIPVVMGGPHVSDLPDEALDRGADFVVRGEGEETFPELIAFLNGDSDLTPGDIPGISWRMDGSNHHNPSRPRPRNLSDYPWPDFSLIRDFQKIYLTPIMASRGCPFNCKFCQVTQMFGREVRFREATDVVGEIGSLMQQYPRSTFFFYDDNLTAHPDRAKELFRLMISERVTPRWIGMGRVEMGRDPELLDLMRRSGCVYMLIGFESINPRSLIEFNKRQTVGDIDRAIRGLHRRGIGVHGLLVSGSDEDDAGCFEETFRWSKRVRLDTMHYAILTPLPGTPLFDEMDAAGRIFDYNWDHYDGLHCVFLPKQMSPAQLQYQSLVGSMRKFYSVRRCMQRILPRPRFAMFRFWGHWAAKDWRSRYGDTIGELEAIFSRDPERGHRGAAEPFGGEAVP